MIEVSHVGYIIYVICVTHMETAGTCKGKLARAIREDLRMIFSS